MSRLSRYMNEIMEEYGGFYATPTQLAFIFAKDKDAVLRMYNTGYNIVDAIENAPQNGDRGILRKSDDTNIDMLTLQEQEVVKNFLYIVDSFLITHRMQDDEDMRQELYMALMKTIKQYYEATDITVYISINIARRYVIVCRNRVITMSHQVSIEEQSIHQIEQQIDHSENIIDEVVEYQLLQEDMKAVFQDVLQVITERERMILTIEYGLEDGQEKSLSQTTRVINAKLGTNLSIQRIRQIRDRALRKLRRPCVYKILKHYK